jgi:hypothetical protein
MIAEALFSSPFELRDYAQSLAAKRLLEKLAEQSQDTEIMQWMQANQAYEFSGLCNGYVTRIDGVIRIALNRDLLRNPDSLKTQFAGGHELGHVRQLLRNETESKLFTKFLYFQELDASDFASKAVTVTGFALTDRIYMWRSYHHILALEATFPGVSHVVIPAIMFFGAKYVASKTIWRHQFSDKTPGTEGAK